MSCCGQRSNGGGRLICLFSSLILVLITVIIVLPLVWRKRVQEEQDDAVLMKMMQFQDFLVGHGISSRHDLDRYGSPQFKAVEWLTMSVSAASGSSSSIEDSISQYYYDWWFNNDDDETKYTLLGAGENARSSLQVLDRYVLAVLYFSLNGEAWSDTLNFLDAQQHVCDWKKDVLVESENVTMGIADCRNNEFDILVPTAIILGT
jgi:hypothetical protein